MNRTMQLAYVCALCAALYLGLIPPEAAAAGGFALATSDYWSDADLKALAYGGLVNEDVMQKIWDISQIPLEFTDLVGYGANMTATPTSWTTDSLPAPDITNAAVDGADAGASVASGGARVQNHAQICEQPLAVTERAQAVDTIGRANERAYQIAKAQRINRRDIEAIAIYPQASVADDGNTTAGKVGGFPSWLTSNDDNGAGGSATGFNTSTGVVAAPTGGTTRALTITILKNIIESVYLNNGNIMAAMSIPQIIRRLNAFIIANPTSVAIATPTANIGSKDPTAMTAQGYVSVIITDFGTTLELIPNRLQQQYSSKADLLLIDPAMVELCNLIPEHASPLGKDGTADKDQVSQQWSLRVFDEKAHGVIRDLTPTGTITA